MDDSDLLYHSCCAGKELLGSNRVWGRGPEAPSYKRPKNKPGSLRSNHECAPSARKQSWKQQPTRVGWGPHLFEVRPGPGRPRPRCGGPGSRPFCLHLHAHRGRRRAGRLRPPPGGALWAPLVGSLPVTGACLPIRPSPPSPDCLQEGSPVPLLVETASEERAGWPVFLLAAATGTTSIFRIPRSLSEDGLSLWNELTSAQYIEPQPRLHSEAWLLDSPFISWIYSDLTVSFEVVLKVWCSVPLSEVGQSVLRPYHALLQLLLCSQIDNGLVPGPWGSISHLRF
jgi:hypothetical protein